jgi:type IV secretion system protein VirB8
MTDELDYQDARTWHYERYESVLRSRRLAWGVAGVSLTGLLLALGALVLLVPLKQSVPYVILKDRETGAVQVAHALGGLDLSQEEALSEFNLTRYLAARETYDPDDLQRNYDLVYAYSSSEAWEPYAELYSRDQPGNLLDQFRKHTRVEVSIKNISFLEPGRALVRFATRTRNQGPGLEEHWVATVTFRYVAPPRDFTERSEKNPLGFQVTHYRKDQEVVHADSKS